MKVWKVTLKTGQNLWSTVEVEADNHDEAIAKAQALLGDYPCSEVQ